MIRREEYPTKPAIISYKRVPTLHQSTERPYGCPNNTSGATYSGVPKDQAGMKILPQIV